MFAIAPIADLTDTRASCEWLSRLIAAALPEEEGVAPRDGVPMPPCGWSESSLDLMRGLVVIEHDWPQDSESEELMQAMRFA